MSDEPAFDPSGYPTLYWGDTDDEPPSYWVSYLQQLLVDNGEDPQGVDGFFGPHTHSAVQSFQRSHGA
ncbi:MAG TPA: peptidoglycan-binding domain-containing protein, partial [Acidimicrobiales bacterium]